MRAGVRYRFEYGLIALVALISVLGFWDIFFGTQAQPQPHHFLHVATAFIWLGLLLWQLVLVDRGRFASHRSAGLTVLFAAPLLVATTAMLSVHSAHRGLLSGEGDFLIVQNVMGTIELTLLILFAFLVRKRRQLHGASLMSTSLLFMGIALFFALISFAPPFRIEGPETFYRFQTAGMTAQIITLAVAIIMFVRYRRNGWPYLLAAGFFPLNDGIRAGLASAGLIDPLTLAVGSMNLAMTFGLAFALTLILLAAMVLPDARRQQRPSAQPGPA